VVKKKAKGSSKGKAIKAVKNSGPEEVKDGASGKEKTPVDMVKVRENIDSLVGHSAEEIAKKVIAFAKDGQLASVKYLFEAVGLYPATEETRAKAPEESLAYKLLKRIAMPTEEVISNENPLPGGAASAGEEKESAEAGTLSRGTVKVHLL